MRRGAAVAVAVVCAAVLGLAALAGADPPTGTVAPYAIPALTGPIGVTGGPQDIATGSDGSLWFTESASDYEVGQLGTVAESGAVEEPTGATGLLGAQVIAPGTAGTMWFTQDDRVHTIGELAITTETVTPSPVLDEKSEDTYSFAGVAVDPLGDVWATVSGNHGSIVELSPPYDAWTQPKGPTGQTGPTGFDDLVNNDDVSVQPGSIVLGPDANMWFTENTLSPDGADQIGTFSPTASPSPPTLYPSASSPLLLAGRLGNIVVGPDGNLWVGLLYERPPVEVSAPLDAAGTGASYVLRITPSGAISEYQLPTGSDADPDVLAVGPDGRLWMPDATDGGLTAISTDGTFASYPGLLPTGADITAMVADPGGADALWLTDQASNAIYRVALQPPATNTPPTTTTTTTTSTTAATTSPPATVLSVTLAAVSAVTKSGATLSGTIVALPGPQTPVTYEFQYGTATAYGSQTAAATATATPAGASVSTTLSGLTPYTTYHYRLVASDCAAASCQDSSPDQTFTTGSTLQPQLNATVGVTATEGQVLIKLPGKHGFVRLHSGELLPLGATIDARHGTVLIQSATAPGGAEGASGLFSGGIFVLTQRPGSTVTVLGLVSSFASCPGARVMARLAAVESKKKKRAPASKKVVNQVFGNAHGHFSTRGHYATAADQGTRWSTADRCDGTLIAVTLGQVTVTDRLRHRTFVVRAGHHYLANHG